MQPTIALACRTTPAVPCRAAAVSHPRTPRVNRATVQTRRAFLFSVARVGGALAGLDDVASAASLLSSLDEAQKSQMDVPTPSSPRRFSRRGLQPAGSTADTAATPPRPKPKGNLLQVCFYCAYCTACQLALHLQLPLHLRLTCASAAATTVSCS